MSKSLNRVTLLGNLGRDAETRSTAGGTAVANFSVATERRWKDKASGEWKSETDWHAVVLWNAENIGKYLTKGVKVYIEGRLQTRSYEKDGRTVYTTEVVADNLILLGAPGGGGNAAGASDDDAPF